MTKKIYRRVLIVIFVIGLFVNYLFIKKYYDERIPGVLNVYSTDEVDGFIKFPISYKLDKKNIEVSAAAYKEINKSYTLKAKAFGIIPIKNVSVNVIDKVELIPCGIQIGIYLKTDGVMVIGTGEVTDINGNKSNPSQNIIKENDYITSINGELVCSKSQLIFLINKYGSSDIVLGIRRGESNFNVKVTPVETDNHVYMIGIWVRDDSQGIGTLTYLTKDGRFAALGHGISDIDTNELLSSVDGILYKTNIWGIRKGENGKPGGILGSITYEKNNEYGIINNNTNFGIFGKANEQLIEDCKGESMEMGLKQDVKKGKAYIRTYLNGSCTDYEIRIDKVNYNENKQSKNMEIEIVDEDLLNLTNGIIQGMSGSPIIQDGKLIGAVTHVFVDDPTKGYGIFIEEMMAE